MIENIERFCAELRLHAFGDLRIFQQGHVEVIETRPNEVPAHSISDLPKRFLLEEIWVEIGLPRARILVYKQRAVTGVIAGYIDGVRECSTERVVVGFRELDGFSFGQYHDAGERPAFGESLRGAATELVKGQLDSVAHRQVLRDVENRQGAVLPGIEWVGCIERRRAVVDRLFIGVGDQEVGVFLGVFQAYLEGVKTRADGCDHVRVADEVIAGRRGQPRDQAGSGERSDPGITRSGHAGSKLYWRACTRVFVAWAARWTIGS